MSTELVLQPKDGLIKFMEPHATSMARLMSINAPGVDTMPLVMQELEYLEYKAVFLPEIKDCIPDTIVAAVKSVIKQNLSLDPDAGLVYITTRNVQVGGQWGKALEIHPSPDGKISIARQCGRVLDLEKPYCTFMADGRVDTANIKIQVPGYDEKMQPCTRWELVPLGYKDFDRLRWFSHRDKSRNKQDADAATLNYANSLYTSWHGWIDPEFACAKVINAAMKRKGTNASEKRVNITPGERFVSPEVLQALADEGLEYTGFEEIKEEAANTAQHNTPAPIFTQPAAEQPAPAQTNTESQPAQTNNAPTPLELIAAAETKEALESLWKANEKEWKIDVELKNAVKIKKASFKATPPATPPAFSLDETPAPVNNLNHYIAVQGCADPEAIRAYYAANKEAVNGDQKLKDYLVECGQCLANNRERPVCPVTLPGAPAITNEPEDFKLA